MISIPIQLVYEDIVSQTVMEKMIAHFIPKFQIVRMDNCYGHSKMFQNFSKYLNAASHGINYFILTDLDRIPCPVELIKNWSAGNCPNNLIFRIAVHEVESWLLADRTGFASFFAVSESIIPKQPDEVIDAKESLISLGKRSRRRKIREGIVPIDSFARIGPSYNDIVPRFVNDYWKLENARLHSPSLERALQALDNFLP